MPDETPSYRFYGDWAVWWPLVSPPGEYAEEASAVPEVTSDDRTPRDFFVGRRPLGF